MNESAIRKTRDAIVKDGIIVAVRLGSGTPVIDVCRALVRGGLHVLELTLTTPTALETIEALADDPALIVGAGTVLSNSDVDRVHDVGGRFAFSPVVDAQVIQHAHKRGLLAVPGAATPTEILAAHRHGAHLVKVFPSAALGGPAFLRAVRGPLPSIPLVPTSGPTADTLADYVDAGAVAIGVGGAELFPAGFTLQSVEQAAERIRCAYDIGRQRIPRD